MKSIAKKDTNSLKSNISNQIQDHPVLKSKVDNIDNLQNQLIAPNQSGIQGLKKTKKEKKDITRLLTTQISVPKNTAKADSINRYIFNTISKENKNREPKSVACKSTKEVFSQFTDSTEQSKTGDQQIPIQSKKQIRRMDHKL